MTNQVEKANTILNLQEQESQPPSLYHHLMFWQKLNCRQRRGNFYSGKREGFRCALIGTVDMGCFRQANLKQDILYGWLHACAFN